MFRHYLDPDFHFREQFRLQPLASPYVSLYAIGAALMLVLPPLTATKAAVGIMLALLPAGMAVLFWGMKRSPLLGVLGLGVVWGNLTHWGFINFVGALGVFCAAVGLALRLVDRPTPARGAALALTLIALFFTHVYRFPFAICAVLGAALLAYPATGRLRPILLPLLPALLLFIVWLLIRSDALRADTGPLRIHPERLRELPDALFSSFHDPRESKAFLRAGQLLLAALGVTVAARLVEPRPARLVEPRARRFTAAATAVPLACAAVFLGCFLVLPMEMGVWWYVYPREATTALLLALGAFPDLPTTRWLRASVVLTLAAAAIPLTGVVVDNYRRFDAATEDFHAITRDIPQAPKLLYLIFDHQGSTRTTTPFVHLPAWVQAERGGWLSFHFVLLGTPPFVYRDPGEPGAVVPPPVPLRWEWTPQRFDVRKHGAFFDWFLIRNVTDPSRMLRADPAIEQVSRVGTWWLYRRRAGEQRGVFE
ncbi:1,4-alpha-glucan (glycogen) branching enzyme, GH-13-type [Chondromyces apiculatus DSM 436]|uniref:1,4-alpha-glucan (Glycogen) branching enzyme, GH-13-type n=1 Tax=Chondromyces apiculatus DSM 436 TaxID=1192034 RepID=A0A017SVS3_9BACT|nr:1,4-alpha-glucan (glycogen) branching enzyme, GH-13-type [Chondromyces apiculatus DSM 436]